jgi:enoyl-CoA hydratase/carnithine racemase
LAAHTTEGRSCDDEGDHELPTPTDVLSYTVRDRKAYITLNRPKQMNALNLELLGALAKAFGEADADDGVFVVILSGAGGRAFSAGGDLKEMSTRLEAGGDITGQDSEPSRGAMSAHPAVAKAGAMRGFDDVNNCSKPVIAAIDGYCLAGGLEIALYCDIRIATRQSSFAMPEPKRHLLSGPAFVHLSRMIPLGEAMHMELLGEPISSERAYQIGLVQGLYEDRAALEAAAETMADKILENSPLAVQFLKRIVKEGRDMTVDHHWKFAEMFAFTLGRTEDALEGPKAFAEKRKPEWKMR